MATVTAQEVREQFLLEDRQEAERKIADNLRESLDQETVLSLMAEIGKQLNEAVERDGVDIGDWNRLDHLTWLVKEAYVAGFLQSLDISMTANEQAYEELFLKGATNERYKNQPGGFRDAP